MKYKEIETKYAATKIKFSDFKAFVNSLNPIRHIQRSSYDHYFERVKNDFIRYRSGERPELTRKFKLNSEDNFIRTEINLPIRAKMIEHKRLNVVTAFCNSLDFHHNFTIFKTCEIYYYDRYNVVFYIVYDPDFTELGRFVEIEMDEHYPWTDEAAAWKELIKIEKKFKKLGITAKDRLNDSLYERYRK